MLRPHTATSAYGVKKYFEVADYYSQGQETVGLWGGRLADAFGLKGQVTKEAFGQLCDNINPATGEQLTLRMNEKRRIGEDFVFSLPKDVGAYIMLRLPPAEREAMLEQIGGRVEQVMKMIEADVETRVRRDGAFENRAGDGLVYAGFRHTTARPVEGFAPDPHPHWHMFAFNATRDNVEDGRIKAADFAKIYRDRPFYESVFYSLVTKDLAEAGLPLERRPDGKWGLAGLQPLGKLFSKRTGEIEDEAKRLNIVDEGRKSKLGATTRSKKDKELTPAELNGEWDAQLTPELRQAIERVRSGGIATARAVTPAEAVAYALEHCSEKLSVIPERELIRVALLHGVGNVTLGEVEAELPRAGVFTEVIDGRVMATTEKLQEEENAIVKFAAAGKGTVEPAGVAEGLTRKLANKSLNDGQWAAVQGLLNTSNMVNMLEGPAGAGKSALLAKYDEGMRLAGQKVNYFATTAKAVEVLQEDGFADTQTVAHLLKNTKLQAAIRGSTVVVDEVSMLGHRDALELCRVAQTNDLKLIMVGDPLQHGAVSRGAIMRVLTDYAGIKPFRLTEIMRQEKPEYRAAATLLSQGKTVEGLEAIDRLGWVHEMDDDDRVSHIAADYLQAQTELTSLPVNKRILVVSPTHAGAGRITDAIRTGLRDAGMLTGEDRGFTRLVAVDTSVAERGQATTYRPGDVLVFHQNAKGFKKGERVTVADPAAVPLSEAARFSVYRTVEDVKLAAGDRIMFNGNVRTVDGKHTLKNGMVRGVAEFTLDGNIRLDDGKLIAANAGHWNHAYCVTSFGSQGKTVQRVIVDMPSASRGAINQEQMYVSASRGREWMRVYTDDKAELKAAVQRSSRKMAALDIKRPKLQPMKSKPQRWHRLRKHLDRLRRLRVIDRTRAAWENVRPQPQVQRQKERINDHGHGR